MSFKMGWIYISSVVCFLSACSKQEVKSVDYYSKNRTEAEMMMNACGANPKAAADENCKNAMSGRAMLGY